MTKIKLCGLKSLNDIEIINKYNPEYIGFIFYKKSKRYIDYKTAKMLKNALNKNILAVGVFVNEDINTVVKLLNENIIDIAQLHGNESENYIKTLKKLTNKTIIKAFKVENTLDIKKAKQSQADFVLLDSGTGGTGQTFNWSLIDDFNKPYFLAGGLSIENIKTALDMLSPYALDVSSGIETDNKKDPEKIKAFIQTVRQHERI